MYLPGISLSIYQKSVSLHLPFSPYTKACYGLTQYTSGVDRGATHGILVSSGPRSPTVLTNVMRSPQVESELLEKARSLAEEPHAVIGTLQGENDQLR